MDYRLNPFAGSLPEWYTPYDSDDMLRRWSEANRDTTPDMNPDANRIINDSTDFNCDTKEKPDSKE